MTRYAIDNLFATYLIPHPSQTAVAPAPTPTPFATYLIPHPSQTIAPMLLANVSSLPI